MADPEELKAKIEDAKIEMANSEGAARYAIAEGIISMENRYREQCAALEEQRRAEEHEALSYSPIGRLIWAIAHAMQYDYLSQEDLAGIIANVNRELERQGLRVLVEKIDD